MRSPVNVFTVIAVVLSLMLIIWMKFQLNSPWLIAYIFGINLMMFLYYGYDKAVAKYLAGSGLWRVPEKVLHGIAFAGGTPAAVLAQNVFRHKTIKRSFRSKFWLVLAVQVLIIVAWLLYRIF